MPRDSVIRRFRYAIPLAALAIICPGVATAAEKTGEKPLSPEVAEFFETKVRPLLADNCFECHSSRSKALKGGLRLDSRKSMITGGESGEVLVPGKPDESPLIHAIRWQSTEMPPRGKLADEQIAVLVKWVKMGAPWPNDEPDVAPEKAKTYDWKQLRAKHWAWQPIALPALPKVTNRNWPQNEIDTFVLAKLEANGLKPSPPASARVLVRRLYFDLLGLPPTPAEVAAFEKAAALDRPAAVDALVDRLLDSPHYGERWGRHWLDVARYNDGLGGDYDDRDQPLTNAWRYRDWVVAALNRDLPMDEFLRLQLAGDLIAKDQAVATGFLALGPKYSSDGGDPDAVALAMAETLDDRVDTLSRGLLGLTVSCARCHDHKFDPIPQLDYYSLAGVFRNTRPYDLPLASDEEVRAHEESLRPLRELEEKIRKQRQLAKKKGKLSGDEEKELNGMKVELERLRENSTPKYPFVHTVAESEKVDMRLAIRGNLLKEGAVAPRRFLRILAGEDPPRFTHGSGRLDLADALVSPANPLTARVMVNRVWLWHFGQALVRTPSNFGTLGERPTHPELLDWLASRFTSVDDGGLHWSLKRLHRLIVSSAAYQMESAMNAENFAVDGDNRLLWRMNPQRLDVESWRDALLSATGELDETIGGPAITRIAKSTRRTLYAAVSRKGDGYASDAFLRLFDFPQARATSEGRTTSIVPQQSLFLMNHPFMAARARALAARLERDSTSNTSRIEQAYKLLYGRPVTREELGLGLAFLSAEPTSDGEKPSAEGLSTWEQYAQVLLSASEMMYLE